MIPKVRLRAWAGGAPAAPERPAFHPAHALYAPPNADGQRKSCGNCQFFLPAQRACHLHAEDVSVAPLMFCGRHAPGTPGGALPARVNSQPLTPELSGLRPTGAGATCDTCRFYEPAGQAVGVCAALADEAHPDAGAQVHPLGCCARWESADGP